MTIPKSDITDLDRVFCLRSRLYLFSGQFACRNHVSTFPFPSLDHSPAPRSWRSHCFPTAKNPPQADWRGRRGLWRHGQTSPFFLFQISGDGGRDGCHYPSVILQGHHQAAAIRQKSATLFGWASVPLGVQHVRLWAILEPLPVPLGLYPSPRAATLAAHPGALLRAARTYKGMLPCFLDGLLSVLFCSISRARMIW